MYEKELDFVISTSYGAGRYDEQYERFGQDYPYGYVRWTEQRNFEAVLHMLASGRLKLDALITHRIPLAEAPSAYEKVQTDKKAMGVVLEYADEVDRSRVVSIASIRPTQPGRAVMG